MYIIIKRLS